MSTQNLTTTKKSINGAIRLQVDMWWMRGFAKQTFEGQQRYLRMAVSFLEDTPDKKEMGEACTDAQRKDLLQILAASFWGQHYMLKREEDRVNQILECWEGRLDDDGKYRPYSNR